MIVPVIIGATGIVTKCLRKNLESIPGKHSVDLLQKAAILGTSHIRRKVLQCETGNLSGGDCRWFKISNREKRHVTRDYYYYYYYHYYYYNYNDDNDGISKSFRKYLSSIPGKHKSKELQETDILGTAHILRKILI